MKIKNKANFLSSVKEAASTAIQKGEQISYDLEDANTVTYVSNLLQQVQESAGEETTLGDLFKWTTEDFCSTLTDITFPDVQESSAELKVDGLDDMVTKVADDATSMHSMIQNAADEGLLREQLGIVVEESIEDLKDTLEEVVDKVTDAVGDVIDTAKEVAGDVLDVVEDTVDDVVDAVGDAVDSVGDIVEDLKDGDYEGVDGKDDETAETTDETAETTEVTDETEVKESADDTVQNPFSIITDRQDESEWPDLNLGDLKIRLREVMESGAEGMEDVIREVYAVVGDIEDSTTWKYPHHVVTESNEILINKAGLDVASNYVSTRFKGDSVTRSDAAKTLSSHYEQFSEEVPAHIQRVAESNIGVHMISLEILDANEEILTLENTQGAAAVGICVAESVANALQNTGLVDLADPTVITIDHEQLGRMSENLTGFIDNMMGNEVEVVQESAPDTTGLETQITSLSDEVNLYKKKVDALNSLLEGSPLEGVAESVVSAEQVESVEALQSVADSIGVKRLITTRKQTTQPAGEDVQVTESAAGLDTLVALSRLVNPAPEEEVKPAEQTKPITKKPTVNRLTNFV